MLGDVVSDGKLALRLSKFLRVASSYVRRWLSRDGRCRQRAAAVMGICTSADAARHIALITSSVSLSQKTPAFIRRGVGRAGLNQRGRFSRTPH